MLIKNKSIQTFDAGNGKIDLRALHAVAPLMEVRIDQLHMKRNGAKDGRPSLCFVMTIPKQGFIYSQVSLRMLSAALQDFGYEIVEKRTLEVVQ